MWSLLNFERQDPPFLMWRRLLQINIPGQKLHLSWAQLWRARREKIMIHMEGVNVLGRKPVQMHGSHCSESYTFHWRKDLTTSFTSRSKPPLIPPTDTHASPQPTAVDFLLQLIQRISPSLKGRQLVRCQLSSFHWELQSRSHGYLKFRLPSSLKKTATQSSLFLPPTQCWWHQCCHYCSFITVWEWETAAFSDYYVSNCMLEVATELNLTLQRICWIGATGG